MIYQSVIDDIDLLIFPACYLYNTYLELASHQRNDVEAGVGFYQFWAGSPDSGHICRRVQVLNAQRGQARLSNADGPGSQETERGGDPDTEVPELR